MTTQGIHTVTGAFGYSGQYIAKRLLQCGYSVRTLTNSPSRTHQLQGTIEVYPFFFYDYNRLVNSLHGTKVFYNTYWVRYKAKQFSHDEAVDHTLKLIKATKEAGVERFVHVSITNPSEQSSLTYFKGKAILERALMQSGMSYAILRPTVLFGPEDILINNIVWMLRRFPFFALFGDGMYKLQPIYVDDLAQLAVEQGKRRENCIIDAIGPETFTYRELVQAINEAIGKRRPIVPLPPSLVYIAGFLVGKMVGDIIINHEEIKGLMDGLLCTSSLPAGATRFTDWIKENAASLGNKYSNELARRENRKESYVNL